MAKILTFAVEHRDVVGGQLGLGLDAHKEGGPATGSHDLTGEVVALKGQGKRSLLGVEGMG